VTDILLGLIVGQLFIISLMLATIAGKVKR